MMDLMLTIVQKENTNLAELLKIMCTLKCRIKLDTKQGTISIVGMKDSDIDNIIDSINEVFNVVTAEIIPTEDSFSKKKILETEENDDSVYDEIIEDISVDDENEGNPDVHHKKEKKREKQDSSDTKKISAEDYLASRIADSLKKLDKTKPISDQVEIFFSSIGFPQNEKIIKKAFINSCKLKKIKWETIATELQKEFPNIREEIIVANMKEVFGKWLENYPDVREKYPKISAIALIKIFAKKMT